MQRTLLGRGGHSLRCHFLPRRSGRCPWTEACSCRWVPPPEPGTQEGVPGAGLGTHPALQHAAARPRDSAAGAPSWPGSSIARPKDGTPPVPTQLRSNATGPVEHGLSTHQWISDCPRISTSRSCFENGNTDQPGLPPTSSVRLAKHRTTPQTPLPGPWHLGARSAHPGPSSDEPSCHWFSSVLLENSQLRKS